MNGNVIVSIVGTQHSDGDKDTTEISVSGKHFNKNGKHYIMYDEIHDQGGLVTKNTIKINRDSVEIIKSGYVSSRMVFEEEKRTVTQYGVSMGTLNFGVFTNSIVLNEVEEGLRLHIDYILDTSEQHVADCKIVISTKNEPSE